MPFRRITTISNAPSPSKHGVDRGHAVSGGLDLHKEIRFHQTGSGLETNRNREINHRIYSKREWEKYDYFLTTFLSLKFYVCRLKRRKNFCSRVSQQSEYSVFILSFFVFLIVLLYLPEYVKHNDVLLLCKRTSLYTDRKKTVRNVIRC